MHAATKPQPPSAEADPASFYIPLSFTPKEVANCFDEREEFHQGFFREEMKRKVIRIILHHIHGVPLKPYESVSRYASVENFSMKKVRPPVPGRYYITIEYRYGGRKFKQNVFFDRNTPGGLSGHLFSHVHKRRDAH